MEAQQTSTLTAETKLAGDRLTRWATRDEVIAKELQSFLSNAEKAPDKQKAKENFVTSIRSKCESLQKDKQIKGILDQLEPLNQLAEDPAQSPQARRDAIQKVDAIWKAIDPKLVDKVIEARAYIELVKRLDNKNLEPGADIRGNQLPNVGAIREDSETDAKALADACAAYLQGEIERIKTRQGQIGKAVQDGDVKMLNSLLGIRDEAAPIAAPSADPAVAADPAAAPGTAPSTAPVPQYGYAGIQVWHLNQASKSNGLNILEIDPRSPMKDKLRIGDRIVAYGIGDQGNAAIAQGSKATREDSARFGAFIVSNPGQTAWMRVIRDGKEVTISNIKIGTKQVPSTFGFKYAAYYDRPWFAAGFWARHIDGVFIKEVAKDSPAARAGLQKGDVITEVVLPGGQKIKVKTDADFEKILKENAGKQLGFVVYRGGVKDGTPLARNNRGEPTFIPLTPEQLPGRYDLRVSSSVWNPREPGTFDPGYKDELMEGSTIV